MPTRYLQVIRPKSRLANWAWGPVIMLRIALVLTYLAYVYCSVVAFIAGVPILSFNSLPGYLPVWAALLGISAIVSAVGSLTDRWQKIERWATLVLSAMLLAYMGGLNISAWIEHDINRKFVGGIAVIASILPVARYIYLAAQSGKIHAESNNRT